WHFREDKPGSALRADKTRRSRLHWCDRQQRVQHGFEIGPPAIPVQLATVLLPTVTGHLAERALILPEGGYRLRILRAAGGWRQQEAGFSILHNRGNAARRGRNDGRCKRRRLGKDQPIGLRPRRKHEEGGFGEQAVVKIELRRIAFADMPVDRDPVRRFALERIAADNIKMHFHPLLLQFLKGREDDIAALAAPFLAHKEDIATATEFPL